MKSLLHKTVRKAYRTLMPPGARNSLSTMLLLDRCDRAPEPIADFAAANVLVLAPHMDDETIGCGGTIVRHGQAGAAVTVLYTTDGRRGNPKLYSNGHTPEEILRGEEDLVQTRQAEARAACDILGVKRVEFLNGRDGELAASDAIVSRVAAILKELNPELVYLPSILDAHHDHWMTNRILHAALLQLGWHDRQTPALRGYEVWQPLLANRVADTTAVHATRQQALAVFVSQIEHVDYVRAAEGLSVYRSIHRFNGAGHAEAFFELTPAAYCALFERMNQQA